jgi:uncharacterized protein involved in exopolysaccharide biosynthesis
MIIHLTPRNLVHVVFKRRRAVLGFLGTCLALNVLYIVAAPWKYESDAQVLVKVNFNNPDLARADFGSTQGSSGSTPQQPQIGSDVIKSVVVSYKSMASSNDIERATLTRMTVAKMYPKLVDQHSIFGDKGLSGLLLGPLSDKLFGGEVLDKAVEKLDSDLDVSQLKESNILQISLLNSDPRIAQEGLGTLLKEFFALQQSAFRAPAGSFLEGQLEAARAKQEADNNALRDFKVMHQLSSLPDEREQLLEERKDIAGNLDTAMATLGAVIARKHALETSLKEFETNATLSSGTDAMSHQLDDAQARLTAQLERATAAHTTYPADSPFVVNADRAVADARKRLQDIQSEIGTTVRGGASPVYQALQTDLLRDNAEVSASEAQTASIKRDIDVINARLLEIDRLEGELHQLETRVQVDQDNLTAQLQRVTESRISTDLNKSQITSLAVVQQPTLGYKIARPRWKISTALALLLGLFGGLGFAFFRESVAETFSLPEQLTETTHVPVLATLDYLAT